MTHKPTYIVEINFHCLGTAWGARADGMCAISVPIVIIWQTNCLWLSTAHSKIKNYPKKVKLTIRQSHSIYLIKFKRIHLYLLTWIYCETIFLRVCGSHSENECKIFAWIFGKMKLLVVPIDQDVILTFYSVFPL